MKIRNFQQDNARNKKDNFYIYSEMFYIVFD